MRQVKELVRRRQKTEEGEVAYIEKIIRYDSDEGR